MLLYQETSRTGQLRTAMKYANSNEKVSVHQILNGRGMSHGVHPPHRCHEIFWLMSCPSSWCYQRCICNHSKCENTMFGLYTHLAVCWLETLGQDEESSEKVWLEVLIGFQHNKVPCDPHLPEYLFEDCLLTSSSSSSSNYLDQRIRQHYSSSCSLDEKVPPSISLHLTLVTPQTILPQH